MMTKRMLIRHLQEDGGDLDAEVQIYVCEDGIQGWSEVKSVGRLGGRADDEMVPTVIEMGDCIATSDATDEEQAMDEANTVPWHSVPAGFNPVTGLRL
jgi:hypothetical protein